MFVEKPRCCTALGKNLKMNFAPIPIDLKTIGITEEDLAPEEEEEKEKDEKDEFSKGEEQLDEDDDDDSLTSEEEREYNKMVLEEHTEVVMSIIKPVAITMFIVVLCVLTMNLDSEISQASFKWMPYQEPKTDSDVKKFGGAILNAIVFIIMVVVVTFVLFACFYYRCMKFIYGWLIFSTWSLVITFGGYFVFSILQTLNQPLDVITYSVVLWNFAVGAAISMFFYAPNKMQQGYAILLSVLLALVFTQLPEFTVWCLLIALALYDLAAVLCPNGPLKMLVNLAQDRGEAIPALLYNGSVTMMMAEDIKNNDPIELETIPPATNENENAESTQTPQQEDIELNNNDQPIEDRVVEEEDTEEDIILESDRFEKRRGVKLGLGDFVFYSVLMGRAAMFDITTIITCFLGIVAGLFFTLVLLGIFKQALPALPISIALGSSFYFTTKYFVTPLVWEFGKKSILF